MALPKGAYNPKDYEVSILKNWLDSGMYKPEYDPLTDKILSFDQMKKDKREAWSLICPPPNAYARPHIGNISGYAYQDAVARYQRMTGKKVLVLPGKDHAGLEGEGVFVREVLEKKKINKFDLKREEFYKMMMGFNQENMKKALKDEQDIGLSADFDRNIFTLDDRIVKVVLSTFVQMYKKGMIYKGVRIINWDPKARSTLADNQCKRVERGGTMYEIKYPLIQNRAWYINFRDLTQLKRIKSNKKTIETRALNPLEKDRYFGDILKNDVIICIDKTDNKYLPIVKKVKKTWIFKDLNEALKSLDWLNILGKKVESYDQLYNFYNKISDGYADKINKNGLIAFELEDYNIEKEKTITVATTRPETMFGDTAIAVNPSDKRFKNLIGKNAFIPLSWKKIPIITSSRVKKDFGTGALKITPAHALDDYYIMLEWNSKNPDKQIGYVNVIDHNIKMCGPTPEKYKNHVYKKMLPTIINDLKESRVLIKSSPIEQNILISERTNAIVEPMMSSQWFVDIQQIKKPVIDMIKNKKVKLHPKNMEKAFFHWMDNLRDWAISRSLWWGYRLPVWYAGKITEHVDNDGQIQTKIQINNSEEDLDPLNNNHMRIQASSPGKGWIQDENVLDTWFSSGQWPFATLTAYNLMDTFYPTDVMETGFDILENWVSRMMMFSYIKHNSIPFKDVYLHGLVNGTDGQKMSKSRGNLVNIDNLREQYGTDAVRMVYFYQNSAGASYSMTYDKLKNFKQFMNKIWNASKFVLMNLENRDDLRVYEIEKKDLKLKESKGLLSHIQKIKKQVTKNIEDYEFGLATYNLYQGFWHELADIHIEALKPYIYTFKDKKTGKVLSKPDPKDKLESQKVLLLALKEYLKMLHPFIPFITERVWYEIPKEYGDHKSLLYTKW